MKQQREKIGIYTISFTKQPDNYLRIDGTFGPMDCFHTVFYRKNEEAVKKATKIAKISNRNVSVKLRKVPWATLFINLISMEYHRSNYKRLYCTPRLTTQQTNVILDYYEKSEGSLYRLAPYKAEVIEDIEWAI